MRSSVSSTILVCGQLAVLTYISPVDYHIWGVIQEPVYCAPIRNVVGLWQRLVETWTWFQQTIIIYMRRANSGVTDSVVVFAHQFQYLVKCKLRSVDNCIVTVVVRFIQW